MWVRACLRKGTELIKCDIPKSQKGHQLTLGYPVALTCYQRKMPGEIHLARTVLRRGSVGGDSAIGGVLGSLCQLDTS